MIISKNHIIISNKITFLFLILLSSFGPYVFIDYGIRLEHIVIYAILSYIFLANISNTINNINRYHVIYIPILLLICIPIIGLLLSDRPINNSRALSNFENYVQPFAIVSISLFALGDINYERLLNIFNSILKLFIVLMAVHTLISVSILIFPGIEYWHVFTSNQSSGHDNVDTLIMNSSELARYGGRISGVFTQIFEAGYAYSVALLSWAYLFNNNRNFIKFKHLILMSILIGGILSYSKVFLVLGIVFFVLLFKKWKQRGKYLALSIGVIVLTYQSVIFLSHPIAELNSQRGITSSLGVPPYADKGNIYIDRLVDPILAQITISLGPSQGTPSKVINTFTSGRLSDGSVIYTVMSDVLSNAPVFGYGYGSVAGADFALLEVIKLAGITGSLVYFYLFFLFFYYTFRVKDQEIFKYYLAFVVLTILTSIAAPTITANRISVIFWILTTILVLINSKQPQYKNK